MLSCNFYLIEDGGKLVLVDAGAPRDWHLLVRTFAALGDRLQDLEAVLLTHAHSDHTGFAEWARTTAGAPVWIHQADAAVAKGAKPGKNDGNVRLYLLRLEFYRTLFSLARRGATRLIPVREVSSFADGETLEVPGRPRAVHAPGHTPGAAALLLEGRGVLLTGDVVVTRNPLTGRVGPQIMPSGSTATPRRRCGRWMPWTEFRPMCCCRAMVSPGPRGRPRPRGWREWPAPPERWPRPGPWPGCGWLSCRGGWCGGPGRRRPQRGGRPPTWPGCWTRSS